MLSVSRNIFMASALPFCALLYLLLVSKKKGSYYASSSICLWFGSGQVDGVAGACLVLDARRQAERHGIAVHFNMPHCTAAPVIARARLRCAPRTIQRGGGRRCTNWWFCRRSVNRGAVPGNVFAVLVINGLALIAICISSSCYGTFGSALVVTLLQDGLASPFSLHVSLSLYSRERFVHLFSISISVDVIGRYSRNVPRLHMPQPGCGTNRVKKHRCVGAAAFRFVCGFWVLWFRCAANAAPCLFYSRQAGCI
jgi:hypothetical protein